MEPSAQQPHAVGARPPPRWTSKDASSTPSGRCRRRGPADELEFTTENSQDVTQRALPTMAVVLGAGGGRAGQDRLVQPGDARPRRAGRQPAPEIPVEGELEAVSEITGIYDKGWARVVIRPRRRRPWSPPASRCSPPQCRPSSAARAAGAATAARRSKNAAPEREPDHKVTYVTRPDQALIYRLSGDRNPLHSDPRFAAMAGFDRPILHGLCTYGFTGRALLHALAGGDPARSRAIGGPVLRPCSRANP